MHRRNLLRLAGSTLVLGVTAPTLGTKVFASAVRGPEDPRLYFEIEDLPRIRANARSPLLRDMYQDWAGQPLETIDEALDKFDASGDHWPDFRNAVEELSRSVMVQLIDPSEDRERAIVGAIDRIIAIPHWDYFRDGGTEILGVQLASFATFRLVLAREVLGGAIDKDLDRRLLTAIGDKGCQACYNTVYDMDHPETVKGWDFDEHNAGFYDISMDRWPMILGANNLRAAPTGALGIGAIALQGHDDRAEQWLRQAETSTERFLKLISPDGSYFEGLSYLSYSLRTTLPFIEAHRRNVGTIDWIDQVNFAGMVEFILSMQLGRRPDGSPDIVNFSDSSTSVSPGAIALIGDYSGSPLAGFAANEAGQPRWFYDFLWYRPEAPKLDPPAELLNKRNDLNWIICRSGWEPDDAVLAFKSGGPANHEHADRNHITFKAYQERLLNDHFGAAYDRRRPGWKMRFTEAHNAVLVDGRGHPYVDGIEGTNDSKAFANILQYEDHGDRVWWTSDASAAYILDNHHVHQVLRTVLFAKPDVFVVVDQVRLRYRPQTVDVRFFPDNADGAAGLKIEGNRFVISRPNAELYGYVVADTQAVTRRSRLDVPEDVGDFPCIEVHSPDALSHHIVTVLYATPGTGSPAPNLEVTQEGNRWMVQAGGLEAMIETTTHAPIITVT